MQVHRVAEPHSWVGVLPLGQVTSTEQQQKKAFLDPHPSWTSSWHYFCILCILLGKLSDYHVFGCASIRHPCIVQSYNTRSISLSHQNFHSNRTEFIHMKRKLNRWQKVLPSHTFKKYIVQGSWITVWLTLLDDPWDNREITFQIHKAEGALVC